MFIPERHPVEGSKIQKQFFDEYKECMKKAEDLVAIRGTAYDGKAVITDYFPRREWDCLYEVKKKLMRVENILELEKTSPHEKINMSEPLEDSLLDIINYIAFAFVFRKMIDR